MKYLVLDLVPHALFIVGSLCFGWLLFRQPIAIAGVACFLVGATYNVVRTVYDFLSAQRILASVMQRAPHAVVPGGYGEGDLERTQPGARGVRIGSH